MDESRAPENSWRDQILARFPDWESDAAAALWPTTKASLSVGQDVSGPVIARAPFGVWIDIGVGHPAVLLVPEMRRSPHQRITFDDYPLIGGTIAATIVALGDRAEIALSQFPPGS